MYATRLLGRGLWPRLAPTYSSPVIQLLCPRALLAAQSQLRGKAGKGDPAPPADDACITLAHGVRRSSPKSKSNDDDECTADGGAGGEAGGPADGPRGGARCGKGGAGTAGGAGGSNIKITLIPASCPVFLSYDDRNMLKNRKLSPHLRIYKKQLTSVMSILLRISGFIMALGIWTIGLTALLSDCGINDWVECIQCLEFKEIALRVFKFLIILPFAYHVVAGTRHLIWHLNVFLSKRMIYATGYLAIVLTIALALALTLMTVERDDAEKKGRAKAHEPKTDEHLRAKEEQPQSKGKEEKPVLKWGELEEKKFKEDPAPKDMEAGELDVQEKEAHEYHKEMEDPHKYDHPKEMEDPHKYDHPKEMEMEMETEIEMDMDIEQPHRDDER